MVKHFILLMIILITLTSCEITYFRFKEMIRNSEYTSITDSSVVNIDVINERIKSYCSLLSALREVDVDENKFIQLCGAYMQLWAEYANDPNLVKMPENIVGLIYTEAVENSSKVNGDKISNLNLYKDESGSYQAKGWRTLSFTNGFSFSFPPTMEIQDEKYIKYAEQISGVMNTSTIVIQQKGLNSQHKGGFEKYARIMFHVESGDYADFENLIDFSLEEKRELDKILREQVIQELKLNGKQFDKENQLMKWYPISFGETPDNQSYIKIKYIRAYVDKPQVLVSKYLFFASDKMYQFILAYRMKESDCWSEDFEKVLESVEIKK